MLSQLMSLCHERSASECPDWCQRIVASDAIKTCLLPALQHKDEEILFFAINQVFITILFQLSDSICKHSINFLYLDACDSNTLQGIREEVWMSLDDDLCAYYMICFTSQKFD